MTSKKNTSYYYLLELVNLYYCNIIINCEFFKVLLPYNLFNFGLKQSILIKNGYTQLPNKSGLGINLDWDFVDKATFKKF